MKKKLFFSFACFVGFALIIAWQFAAAELADLQKEKNSLMDKKTIQMASSHSQAPLFV